MKVKVGNLLYLHPIQIVLAEVIVDDCSNFTTIGSSLSGGRKGGSIPGEIALKEPG